MGRPGERLRVERRRVPAPLIRYRIPSGRGAMEQPNAAGDGDAPLTLRLWAALVGTGVAAGLLGAGLMAVLFTVQRLAFGDHPGGFEGSEVASSGGRRLAALAVGGAVSGVGWWLLRRATAGESSDVDDALWRGHARLGWRRSLGTGVLSEVAVGAGASLGREAAPKLLGGVAGSLLAGWAGLSTPQRRLLVACGAGAGLACVYDVPVAGALFTAEVLLGTVALPVVLPALVCSGVATLVARVYLPDVPIYGGLPPYRSGAALLVFALLLGPLAGLAAVGYIRLIAWVSHHRVRGRAAPLAPLVAFVLLGLLALRWPQLLGNGKGLAHDAFVGAGGLATLAALAALKPLVTALCLGSGASGGLLTPVLATGAVLGAALGIAWSHVWPGAPVGACALVGAAALLGAGMQAPLTALVIVVELTTGDLQLALPLVAATAGATLLARVLDGYSIYSGRLGPLEQPAPEPG